MTGLLAKCSEEKRTAILAVQQDLQESVREEFQAKLQHWKHLPYSILGLLDDDVRRAKATARSCRQEWRISDKAKIHRVAHRFFSDKVIARQFDLFCDTDILLRMLPDLYNMVLMYNSVPLTERSVEAVRAGIQKVLRS